MRAKIWQEILGKINQAILDKKEADLNFKFENINIIEELKDELKRVLSKDEYKKWEGEGFNLNHLFQVEYEEVADKDIYVGVDGSFMHFAACFGLEQLLNALLAAGVEVNIKGEDENTPLHNAAVFGHLDIVNILLYKGAKVNAVDNNKMTPLHCAIRNGHTGVVQALLAVKKGINVNAEDKNGCTPLHYATGNGHIGIVCALLAMPGINVNAKDKYGSTSIGFAQDLASNSGLGYPLGDDERQQWQDVVTIMQQRLEFTRKRDFAAGGATLGTAVGGAGVAAALTAVEYIPWEPKYMILTAMAIALVSLAVGYIVYHAFKEPGTKVNETQSPVKGAQENLVEC